MKKVRLAIREPFLLNSVFDAFHSLLTSVILAARQFEFAGLFVLDISTTLLRERFTIRDTERAEEMPVTAVSNRISLPLYDTNGQLADTFIIRTQNMHSSIRFAAQLLQDYLKFGPILSRNVPINFMEIWEKSLSRHETNYNQSKWVVVYHKGQDIFSSGPQHPFLSIIEKCDAKNPGNYDRAIKIAEDTFVKMGRKVSISYEANIGMVINLRPELARCGLIHRGVERNATFNYTAEPLTPAKRISPVDCLNMNAAFLEGLQLAYTIGKINDQVKLSILKKFSTEEKQAESGLARLEEISVELDNYANNMKLKFRPEKPEFSQAIIEAERFHRKNYNASQQR